MEASTPGFDELRERFVERVERVREEWSEDALAKVLNDINQAAESDLARVLQRAQENPSDYADDVVEAADAWASVASYAVTRVYFEGPESIWRRGGFSEKVAKELNAVARTLSGPLRASLQATGASSFSVAVGFPFGVSVGLSWDLGASDPEDLLDRAIGIIKRETHTGRLGPREQRAFKRAVQELQVLGF